MEKYKIRCDLYDSDGLIFEMDFFGITAATTKLADTHLRLNSFKMKIGETMSEHIPMMESQGGILSHY